MKLIIAVLALTISGSIQAETLLYGKNKLGGKLVLTTEKCSGGSGGFAYSTNPNGDNIHGCWFYDETVGVNIVWSDGSFKTYSLTNFEQPAKNKAQANGNSL
jgi:hypothetical protein